MADRNSKLKHVKEGLRLVSLFEAAKGALVLLAGFGLSAYVHKDLHHGAEQLVRHLHLNPASRYPRIFIDLSNHVTDAQLWIIASAAVLYSMVRFIEAYGIWRQQTWAEWFGLLTGGIYIPFELFEIGRGATWPKLTLLIVNAGIVGYLSLMLNLTRRKRRLAGK